LNVFTFDFKVKKCEIVNLRQKPRPGPKPSQAKPDFWLWAWLTIFSSPSRLKPGQSWGFQAKPELAHHYLTGEYKAGLEILKAQMNNPVGSLG